MHCYLLSNTMSDSELHNLRQQGAAGWQMWTNPIHPTEHISHTSAQWHWVTADSVVEFHRLYIPLQICGVKLNEGKLCVSIATPYRLGFGRVLPSIPGVQRQSGVPILQRPRTPGGLPGNTLQPTVKHPLMLLQNPTLWTPCRDTSNFHTRQNMYIF